MWKFILFLFSILLRNFVFAQPNICGSSFTDITVNGTKRQLVVRYDPERQEVIGMSCTSQGCNNNSFTIKVK